MDDKRKSAYSCFERVNANLEQRRRIPTLTKDVPYLMTRVVALAEHKDYGQGYEVHLRDKDKKMFFVILPSRIVTKVGLSCFDQYKEDIAARQPPFLIFKGMDGNAFDVAIVPFSAEVVQLALNGLPLIEQKVEEVSSTDFDWLDAYAASSSKDSSFDTIAVEGGEPIYKKVKLEEESVGGNKEEKADEDGKKAEKPDGDKIVE